MNKKKLVILNGSIRKKGTSYSFANTIKKLAERDGNSAEILHIIEYLEEGKSFESLRKTLAQCDILCLSSPLYVDCLPYPVVWFFERLSEEFKNELKGKSFFVIGQCAFPYSHLIDTLVGSCRCFAESTEMKWLGGLKYGGGVMINGASLESLGRKGEKITSAFSLALESILKEEEISNKAQEALAIKFPKILSRPMAALLNHRIRSNARKNGLNAKDIGRKAYLE